MSSTPLATILSTLLAELVFGSRDAGARTYVVNRGDSGLLASLENVSAAAASATHGGGQSIAAHVDHLRYGLAVLNRWAGGALPRSQETDWTVSWRKNVVSEEEWRTLRHELRREAGAWAEALRTIREVSDVEAGWIAGSVVHIGYHFGAIRQIDRATRGPTAEDEARAEAALRSS